MTLRLRVEANAGQSIRELMDEMLVLAKLTGCVVDMNGNDTEFWVSPTDTTEGLSAAYDRLYPVSRIVCTSIAAPVRRAKPA